MKIGLVDVDAASRRKVTFPNLVLMKLSAWHKSRGDSVEWVPRDDVVKFDRVYMSKVYSDEYSPEYRFPIWADEIIRGGSGYAITIEDGREIYRKENDSPLPYEIEHIYPDYDLYPQFKSTAFGFLTRGCPRGCAFCHVAGMQGRAVRRVADLSEFWRGQRNIVLLDPNITASRECIGIFRELADTGAKIEFNQGLDVRLMDVEKIRALNEIRYRMIHFAWDDPNDDLRPDFERLAKHLRIVNRRKVSAYVLTNFGSTHEEDLSRIMFLRDLGIQPYVMIYRKTTAPIETKRLQRWCHPRIFWTVPTFDEYEITCKNKTSGGGV